MRDEVEQLLMIGRLPSSTRDVRRVQECQELLEKVKPPVSDEEAAALIALFPADDDDCYGLAWSLVHLVETAANWPLPACLSMSVHSPQWAKILHYRILNDEPSRECYRKLLQNASTPAREAAKAVLLEIERDDPSFSSRVRQLLA